MEQTHDPIRHLKFFRQALSQDKKIGFLISAGCPLGVDMPAGKWPLIPDIENLTKLTSETIIKSANKVKYEKLLEELTKTGKSKDNIEDILSFLRGLKQVAKGGTVRGFSFDDLELLEKEVCKVVVTSMDVVLPDSETSYHKLANWINSIEREYPIEIFTTNYDLLMEQAFEEINVPYFDGFVGSKNTFLDLRILEDDSQILPKHWTCLWKIHGSINWYHEKGNVTRLSLVNKDGMPEIARIIESDLRKHLKVFYDDKGAVGRRYRRQDEAGTPYCITVDTETLNNQTVTVRDRDSMEQIRISNDKLKEYLVNKILVS